MIGASLPQPRRFGPSSQGIPQALPRPLDANLSRLNLNLAALPRGLCRGG
jgi:hypothetical protein